MIARGYEKRYDVAPVGSLGLLQQLFHGYVQLFMRWSFFMMTHLCETPCIIQPSILPMAIHAHWLLYLLHATVWTSQQTCY